MKFTHAFILDFHIIFRDFTENIEFSGFLRKIQRLLLKHTYELTNIIYVDRFQNNLYSHVIVKRKGQQEMWNLFYLLSSYIEYFWHVTYDTILDVNNVGCILICMMMVLSCFSYIHCDDITR